MTKVHATPFYDGYSYSVGDLDCRFAQSATSGLWVIEIRDPHREAPLHITIPATRKGEAYARAKEWCSKRRASSRPREAAARPR